MDGCQNSIQPIPTSRESIPLSIENLNTAFSDAVKNDYCWTPSIFLPIGIASEYIDIIPILNGSFKLSSKLPKNAVLCIGNFVDSDSICELIKQKAIAGGSKLIVKKVPSSPPRLGGL